MDIQLRVLDFLRQRVPKLCVIATSSITGHPECAVMGYSVNEDLSLILSTDKNSRKVQNALKNPHVAATFGWTFDELNIQYEGIATVVTQGGLFSKCEEQYFADHPESLEFKGIPETIYISVKPTWMRMSDYNPNPPFITEKAF